MQKIARFSTLLLTASWSFIYMRDRERKRERDSHEHKVTHQTQSNARYSSDNCVYEVQRACLSLSLFFPWHSARHLLKPRTTAAFLDSLSFFFSFFALILRSDDFGQSNSLYTALAPFFSALSKILGALFF